MKKLLLCVLMSLTVAPAAAQKSPVTLSSERKSDRSVVISAKKEPYVYGTYTVFVDFSRLTNVNTTTSSHQRASVAYDGPIITLRPEYPDQQIGMAYSYSLMRGEIDPKVDSGFVYRMPVTTAKPVMVRKLKHLNETLKKETNAIDFKAMQFLLSPGDTIYAARKGIVVDIRAEETVQKKGMSFSSKYNSVTVEHPDGTYANYGVLADDSFLVEAGDTVFPDTPLALAGSYDGEKYEVRFFVSYRTKPADEKAVITAKNIRTKYIDPIFATDKGEVKLTPGTKYRAVVTPETVRREMTKREIKKLKN